MPGGPLQLLEATYCPSRNSLPLIHERTWEAAGFKWGLTQ